MKTLMKKLEETRNLIIENQRLNKILFDIDPVKEGQRWSEVYTKYEEGEKKAVKNIKAIAKECGFKIKVSRRAKFLCEFLPAYNFLETRLTAAYSSLHARTWNEVIEEA